jgi:CPA1 family monovalent cation:H+ antiporter
MQELATRRMAAEERPPLDVAVQRAAFVRQFPLFADLEDSVMKRLGRSLVTRYVDAGEVLLRKENFAKSVFFIASGAVELESAGQTWRLGRGEMFGQMAILTNKARRADVRAIAPTTLLVLDEDRFRRLLERSQALREAVRSSAEKRGVDPAGLLPNDRDGA